jgi:hypothetical protein
VLLPEPEFPKMSTLMMLADSIPWRFSAAAQQARKLVRARAAELRNHRRFPVVKIHSSTSVAFSSYQEADVFKVKQIVLAIHSRWEKPENELFFQRLGRL